MSKKNNFRFAILSLLFFSTCKPDFDDPKYTAGSANFSKYVAVGSFGTAGYADGALYLEAQQNSYPAILAKQFALVGGGEFRQPLCNAGAGFGVEPQSKAFTSRLYLGYTTDCSGESVMRPLYVASSADMSNVGGNVLNVQSIYSTSGPFNNFGVPGAKIYDFDRQDFGNPNILISENPFYARMASNPGVSTVVDDALMREPTFFTFWIGTQDVYSYAARGGEGGDTITTLSYYTSEMNKLMDKLLAVSQFGAIASIPDINSIPYFTTIPYNGLVITDATTLNTLNNLYASANISFGLNVPNAFIIADPTNPNGFRKIKSTERILLSIPTDSITCGGWGSFKFIPDKYVLRDVEISKINSAIANFNNTIKSIATGRGLAFVDMNTFYKTLQSGIIFNGVDFNAQFISGGAYSLDGVHFNAKGAAMVANEFIKAINQKYNSTIPLADVNAYPGVKFP